MRHAAFVAAILITAVCLTPRDVLSQDARLIGGVGLTVFADPDFQGQAASLRNDTPDFRRIGMNDIVSSLRVGTGEVWEVCEHINFRGRCIVVSGPVNNLHDTAWGDMISSARRVRGSVGGGGVRPPGLTPLPPLRSGIDLFTSTNFSGNRRTFTRAEADLRRQNFNAVARSLRIAPGEQWEVCADTNFRNCLIVNTSWSDLNGLGMARRIRSIRPWGWGPGIGMASIVLFDQTNFRGRTFRVDGPEAQMAGWAGRAQSVQVNGGSWQLCERTGFSGRCITVSQSLPDLGSMNMSRRVASVRPVASPR